MNEGVIRDAWERFICGGELPQSLRPAVTGSWQRCRNFSVDVGNQRAPKLSDAELYRRRCDNALLAASARLAMERTGQILSDASSMLILTDGSGHIIETLGDHRTIDAGRQVHLETGGCWDETGIGTNAIGTAMAVRQPVQIHAAEHFCEKVQHWTCAAAPIFHPIDHELLGVIDISGPPQTFSNQNLALVVSLADHIEGLIGQSIKNEHSRLTARFQEKQRKWGSNDLVAIDRRGAIVCASPEAIRSLATHFGAQSDAPDLSYLKSLPFEDWEGDLARRLANTRTVLVKDGDSELGAIVVFPAKHKSFAECTTSSRKRQAAPVVNVPPTDAPPRDIVASASGGSSSQRGLEKIVFLRSADTDTSPHRSTAKYQFVASDARVKQICGNVSSAARIGLPILIGGQTGTGKEELARFAHNASGRKGAFVPVNCTALPDSLIEAELFGYADGAFTGARRGGSRGLAKEANGGTLFLDEIGDMPFALQSVLLRFLDDYTVRPVGGTSTKVDVLIVSATNVELGQAVTSKRFRADLLYRLNTVHVTLPKLNERTDFEEIVLHLLEKISPGNRITDKAVASLARWAWEGNIRELRSVLARLALSTADLNGTIDEALVSHLGQPSLAQAQGESLRDLQRARLLEVYAETGGNISETARRLNVCRNTVYRALEAQDSD